MRSHRERSIEPQEVAGSLGHVASQDSEITAAVCILAGGPRLNKLARSVGVPTAGLLIANDVSLVEGWPLHSVRKNIIGDPTLLCSSAVDNPREFGVSLPSEIQVEYESRSHRGTAGALWDWYARPSGGNSPGPADSSHVLILESSAYPGVDLEALFTMGADPRYDAVLGVSALGRPAGCMLVKRKLLDIIPSRGFFDLKEQWIKSAVSLGSRIGACTVVNRAILIHTLEAWITAIAAFRIESEQDVDSDEPLRRHPSSVHTTAQTDGAFLSSAIVMQDAIVEPGAVVVRSAIGPNTVVKAGSCIIDRVYSDSPIPWESENLKAKGALR